MSVTVRRAVKTDAEKIAELAIKLFAQHRAYDSRRFADIASVEGATKFYGSQTEAGDTTVLVAEYENKIVGFAFLQFEAMNYSALLVNAVWLHDLYVDESVRGQNIGRALIEKSAEVARKLGADKLMLSAAAKNINAKAFFERRGFKETMVEMMLDLTDKQDND